MRFCHQLPTLLTCFMLNLGVIPQFCRHFHSEAEPRYCAGARQMARGSTGISATMYQMAVHATRRGSTC